MAEKTYKYNSVCERDKPIHTNNRGQFILHVAACPTCEHNLPSEMLKEFDPEVSLIIAQRAKAKQEPSEAKKDEFRVTRVVLPSEPKIDIITIRFKATTNKQRHGSRGIFLNDRQTAEVSPDDAAHVLKHWPDNFEIVDGSLPLTKLVSAPLMTLEERIKKALDDIEEALQKVDPTKKLSITDKEYLENQHLLLKNLLEKDSWPGLTKPEEVHLGGKNI